jgi:hypothetical protein
MAYAPKRLPQRTRCGIVLAAHSNVAANQWDRLVKDTVKGLRQALPRADIVGMVTEPGQEELKAIVSNHRKLGRGFEGCVDVTLPGPDDLEPFREVLPVLRRVLGPVIDTPRCCIVAGNAFYASPGYGNFSFTQLMWRDPKITKEQFIAWWTGHHSEHNLESPSSGAMQGYALHYREDPITTELNAELGFSNDPELYEPCYFRDLESWRQLVTPEVAAAAFEDEKGFLSHHEMRVEIQRVIVQDVLK